MPKKPSKLITSDRDLREAVHRILRGEPVTSGPSAAELLAEIPPELWRAEQCRRSLAAFVEVFWPLVTGVPFEPNRATTAIIAALQSVADGEVTRLLVAVPPGTGKTTLLALYAAWRIARDPSWRSIHASHAASLADTESKRVRRLVTSDAYRAMFPEVALRDDENTAAMWSTTRNGRYFALGTDGALTGFRAHEAVCDDPLNAPDRFSKAERDRLWAWFQESLSTRLDGEHAPMIVVQQRLDRDDLIGRLIAAGGWTLVELPAESDDGTLLAPNVLSREKLDGLKRQIGSAAYACQYLQRPSDDANAAIKRSWWRFYRPAHVPENAPRPTGCDTESPAIETPDKYDRIVIAVDMTFGGTKASNDFCDVAVWGSVGAARYLIERWHRRATQLEQRTAIKALAQKYPTAKVLIEKAAGGAGAIEQLTADGIPNIVPVETGGKNKAARLDVVSATIEAGNCFLPLGAPWLGDFVEELAGATRHDDAQDTTAYALAELNVGPQPRDWVAGTRAFRSLIGQPQPMTHEQRVDENAQHERDVEIARAIMPKIERELDTLAHVSGMNEAIRGQRIALLESVASACRAIRARELGLAGHATLADRVAIRAFAG